MAYGIDIRPLFMRGPSLGSNPEFLGAGPMALARALAARQQEGRQVDALQQDMLRQREEMRFRQGQEARLLERQRMEDARTGQELQAKNTMSIVGAYQKDPKMGQLAAQLYGGTIADKPMERTDIVREDPNSPIGIDFNPEYARAEDAVKGKKQLTIGGQTFDLPAAEQNDFYDQYRQVLGRLPGPAAAMEMARVDEGKALGFDAKETAKLIAEERARQQQKDLMGMRPRKTGGTSQAARGPGSKAADDARSDLNAYLQNVGFKVDQGSMRQFDRMIGAAEEAARGNSSAARVFMGMFTKFAQGEVGVLTQHDIDQFWTQAGSPKERTEEAFARLVSGSLGEAKRQNAVQAIRALKATVQQRFDQVYQGATEVMAPYGSDGDRWLKAYFGKGRAAPRGSGGHDEADALLKGIR